jgi:hypothetical protein
MRWSLLFLLVTLAGCTGSPSAEHERWDAAMQRWESREPKKIPTVYTIGETTLEYEISPWRNCSENDAAFIYLWHENIRLQNAVFASEARGCNCGCKNCDAVRSPRTDERF